MGLITVVAAVIVSIAGPMHGNAAPAVALELVAGAGVAAAGLVAVVPTVVVCGRGEGQWAQWGSQDRAGSGLARLHVPRSLGRGAPSCPPLPNLSPCPPMPAPQVTPSLPSPPLPAQQAETQKLHRSSHVPWGGGGGGGRKGGSSARLGGSGTGGDPLQGGSRLGGLDLANCREARPGSTGNGSSCLSFPSWVGVGA